LRNGYNIITFAGYQSPTNITLACIFAFHEPKPSFSTPAHYLAARTRAPHHFTTAELTRFKSPIITVLDAINTFKVTATLTCLSHLSLQLALYQRPRFCVSFNTTDALWPPT
jgi:hypothetical protein